MNFISKFIKKYKDHRELKKSNFGRDYGWYIEYKGTIIGELVDPQWAHLLVFVYHKSQERSI